MRKKLTTLLTVITITFLTFPAHTHNTEQTSSITVTQDSSAISYKDSIRTELIHEVDNYISKRFPDSRLSATSVVLACEKHDFDLVFALAQAQIESSFGTKGKAARTNSVWNVGQFDGRSTETMNKLGLTYTHPEQSIEPYITLVKTNYLGDQRTYDDLMKRYVSLSGKRYASSTTYETHLKSVYDCIVKRTPIQGLFRELQSYI